ncbi:MAG: M28 family peptidase [Planctomycetaceae bacterium]|nr:M28 family peptidase [Planctomycetaceae bacterium]
MRNTCFVVVACLSIVTASVPLKAQQKDAGAGNDQLTAVVDAGSDTQVADATEAQLRADIKFLASEELRGRSVTDETIEVAASYLVDRMNGIGLKTDLVDGKPRQPFAVKLGSSVGAVKNNRLTLSSDDADFGEIVVDLNQGLMPLALGSSKANIKGPIVFAGYGVTAPKLDYDDYADIDVDGAVVVVLRKEPQASDPDSKFSGTQNTRHAFFATKIANAIKHGAKAVVLVNDPASVEEAVKNVKQRIDQEKARNTKLAEQLEKLPADAANNRKSIKEKIANAKQMIKSLDESLANVQQGVLGLTDAGIRRENQDSIPIVSVSRDVVSNALSKTVGKTLAELEAAIDETGSPQSTTLAGVTATLKAELKPSVANTNNVLGLLPGKGDLADQTVVVGAHYDHVGMGGYGSLAPGTVAIHNGADDNASGTSAMLAIAERMMGRLADAKSHRQILFMGFSAEERGLLGSQHYVKNPVIPLESTVAMVNLDMVGRLRDNELTIYGTGSAPTFDGLVEKANEDYKFDLFKVPSGYGPSDHQSFYTAGVPVLFFFTGLHDNYHRPTDDFDKIEFGGLTRITDIVSDVTFELATLEQRPEYAETENRVRVRRQITAYMGVSLANRENSVVISGLVQGAPAERAGLKTGDLLEKLGDKSVKSSQQVLEFMRSRSPGQKMPVTVKRDGESISVTIDLVARPEG